MHFGTVCKGVTSLSISYKSRDSSGIADFHRLHAPFRPLWVFVQKSISRVFVAQSSFFTSVVRDHRQRPPRQRSTSQHPFSFWSCCQNLNVFWTPRRTEIGYWRSCQSSSVQTGNCRLVLQQPKIRHWCLLNVTAEMFCCDGSAPIVWLKTLQICLKTLAL